MTETGMITSNPYQGGRRCRHGRLRAAGRQRAHRRQRGRVLPPGKVGVLEVKGPNVFKGYWRNPEKTKAEFRKEATSSGRPRQHGQDGRVTIVGRAKDLIITGGFNVYPIEVEGEINSLPGIGELAVVGVPHPDFGEGIIAVVTAAPGGSAPSEAEIISSLAQRLAKFKLPKRVFLAKELPRNSMGKVQKLELAKQYADLFKG